MKDHSAELPPTCQTTLNNHELTTVGKFQGESVHECKVCKIRIVGYSERWVVPPHILDPKNDPEAVVESRQDSATASMPKFARANTTGVLRELLPTPADELERIWLKSVEGLYTKNGYEPDAMPVEAVAAIREWISREIIGEVPPESEWWRYSGELLGRIQLQIEQRKRLGDIHE